MSATVQQLETARGVFRVAIAGAAQAPALILSNSLGTTLEMWDPQVEALARHFRVIRYDTRGHGGSPVTEGPYQFEELGLDVVAILDALHIDQASFCGVSMGGHTGLWLGIYAPNRFNAIAVCNSAAKIGTAEAWQQRAHQVRQSGVEAMQQLAHSAPERWFTASFIKQSPQVVQQAQAQLAHISPEGYASCCEALAQSDLRAELHRITLPTLLVAGTEDPVTTVEDAKNMQAAIVRSKIVELEASHLSNLEVPEAFTQALLSFMTSQLSDEAQLIS
ncbi:MAG: 3-oxoadipate enol-lactonase [Alcaligenaceae bacterium]|nr:3-oxoadipate enol-lactonase [Alcaligenaceae bacterium]